MFCCIRKPVGGGFEAEIGTPPGYRSAQPQSEAMEDAGSVQIVPPPPDSPAPAQLDFVYLKAALKQAAGQGIADLTLAYEHDLSQEIDRLQEAVAAIPHTSRVHYATSFLQQARVELAKHDSGYTAQECQERVEQDIKGCENQLFLSNFHVRDAKTEAALEIAAEILAKFSDNLPRSSGDRASMKSILEQLLPNFQLSVIFEAAKARCSVDTNSFNLRGMLADLDQAGPRLAGEARDCARQILRGLKHDFADCGGLHGLDMPFIDQEDPHGLYKEAGNNPGLRRLGVLFPGNRPGFAMNLLGLKGLVGKQAGALEIVVDSDSPATATGTIELPAGLLVRVVSRDCSDMPGIKLRQMQTWAVNAPQPTSAVQLLPV